MPSAAYFAADCVLFPSYIALDCHRDRRVDMQVSRTGPGFDLEGSVRRQTDIDVPRSRFQLPLTPKFPLALTVTAPTFTIRPAPHFPQSIIPGPVRIPTS